MTALEDIRAALAANNRAYMCESCGTSYTAQPAADACCPENE